MAKKNASEFSVKMFGIKDKGNLVYYVPVTNEIVLHDEKPPKGKKLKLVLTLNGAEELEIDTLQFIGVL